MGDVSEQHTLRSGPQGKWTLAEGATLGGYKVIKPLGRGGMGEVYLVEHIEMGKRYAMKVLSAGHSRDPTFRDRFRVEARLMADLEHPGIVRAHNMGEDEGRYFLVMDYVEAASGEPVNLDDLIKKRAGGDTLRAMLRPRCSNALQSRIAKQSERGAPASDAVVKKVSPPPRLRESEARSLAIGIARALDYAHSFSDGVVHRDLKPGNVLLGADGRVRVSDFGLAKVMGEAYLRSVLDKSVKLSVAPTVVRDGEEGPPGLTQSDGAVLGTFEYMAPEQKEGRADARSDIYSLGLIIYRMLTGKRAEGRFPDPSKLGLARFWDRVIEKTLAPDPDERYASVKELLADLEGAQLGAPGRGSDAGPRGPSGGRTRRPFIVGLAAGVLALLAVLFVAGFLLQRPTHPRPPPPDYPPPAADLPPQVRFVRAPEGGVADPSATLTLEIEASDDRGLGEVGMVYVMRGRATRVVLSRPGRGERRRTVQHQFKLAPLGLRAGETITYYAYALDDDATAGPKEAQSRARRVRISSPAAGDEAAWLAAKREAEARAARGDYQGALGIIKRFLDTAKTIKFKPQAVGLWGEIEQRKVEEERRRRAPAKEQVDRAMDAAFAPAGAGREDSGLDPREVARRIAEEARRKAAQVRLAKEREAFEKLAGRVRSMIRDGKFDAARAAVEAFRRTVASPEIRSRTDGLLTEIKTAEEAARKARYEREKK